MGRPTAPAAPVSPPKPAKHDAHEEHAGEHHCPGHGPVDPPGHVNLWRGMLMIDNEKAQRSDFVSQLLFRYDNKQDPCDTKNTPPPFLANLLNFGLFAYVIARFGKKPLEAALAKRKQQIMSDIETASRLHDEAEERLGDYEDKLDRLEETLAELRAEQKAQAEAERATILREAEDKRARMRRDAQVRVEQELKAAKEALLREALSGAVLAADALLAQKLASSDHDRLADEYLAGLDVAVKGASQKEVA